MENNEELATRREKELTIAIGQVGGLAVFAEVFDDTYHVKLKENNDTFGVVPPEEFFDYVDEETVKEYQKQQTELRLSFFRKNMKKMSRHVVEKIASLVPVDISEDFYNALIQTCRRYHDDPVE
jgi:hypothetical protein